MIDIMYRSTYLIDSVQTIMEAFTIVKDINLDDDYIDFIVDGYECNAFDLAFAGVIMLAQESADVGEFMRFIELNLKYNTIDLSRDEYWQTAAIVEAFGKPTNCSYNTHDGLIWLS